MNQQPTKNNLLKDLIQLIEKGKTQIAVQVNSTMTLVYWQIGRRINEDILNNQRAEYGKQIIESIAIDLTIHYGRSFEKRNLRRMIQFAEVFPDFEIVVPLARQLSWSHFITLIPIKNSEARSFYAIKAAEANWGKRELRKQIERKAFERR